MAEGIYIFTEIDDDRTASYTGELVRMAEELSTEEAIHVFGMKAPDLFYEEEAAEAVAAYLKAAEARYVLVPAVGTAKAIFARAAVLLQVGMTADCMDIYMEDGIFRQSKPAFGNEFVVVTEEKASPAIVTIVTGREKEPETYPLSEVTLLQADLSASGICMIDTTEQDMAGIVDAESILSIGRGLLEGNGYELALALAEKTGAAIGGTRPLVDQGLIPFESQIGQTGSTIHPKSCLFLGVSGAIQHTEGIRDSKVTIAVNTDPHAAIFSFADYGILADGVEFVKALLDKLGE